MSKTLKRWVHVDGQGYGPGMDVPAEVAEQITNPNVWEDGGGGDEPAQPASSSESPRRSARSLKPPAKA